MNADGFIRWALDDEDDEISNGDDTGGVAVKEKPDPPPSWLDDAHPLASQYAQ
jgi:hypothetical protein